MLAASGPLLMQPETTSSRRTAERLAQGLAVALLAGSVLLVASLARDTIWSPYYKITAPEARRRTDRRGQQHLSPVDGAGGTEGILLPVALHGVRQHVQERADPRRRIRHRRRGGAAARRAARGRRRDRSRDHPPRQALAPGSPVLRPARHGHQRRRAAFPADVEAEIRSGGLRADRFADAAIELQRRPARELHVHRAVVPGSPRSPERRRAARHLQLLPRTLAGRSAGQHGGGRVSRGAVRPRARGARVSRRC